MRLLPTLSALVCALALAAVAAAPAAAAPPPYVLGMGDQNPLMFHNASFQKLKIKRVRYIVPWTALSISAQRTEVDAYLATARSFGKEVLISFAARRGCYRNGRYSGAGRCRAPSARAFGRAFKRFRKRYPWIRHYSPWNEVNHVSQPTNGRPDLAVRYYEVVRRNCRRCTIVALDLLDSRNMLAYLSGFRARARGNPRIWGLHNYSDVNRERTLATRALLRAAPGQVWLTETGGLVAFGSKFPYSERRAAARTKTLFRIADLLSKRRPGHLSRITRVYPYQWTGVKRGARFDAGLVGPRGKPRKAFAVFRKYARHRRK